MRYSNINVMAGTILMLVVAGLFYRFVVGQKYTEQTQYTAKHLRTPTPLPGPNKNIVNGMNVNTPEFVAIRDQDEALETSLEDHKEYVSSMDYDDLHSGGVMQGYDVEMKMNSVPASA